MVARTHEGRVRENNEDSIAFLADAGIAVLADGMGGLNAGEVASRQAVDRVLGGLSSGFALRQVIEDANREIFELSQEDAELHNMGTTLVALRLECDRITLANVGDSRIYRYRAGELSQLTIDHSVVQQMVEGGLLTEAQARQAPNRNIITRALGIEGDVEVDIVTEQARAEDVYMLCSDGVTDMLEPDALTELFSTRRSISALADAVVDAANAAGGIDNISAIFVQVDTDETSGQMKSSESSGSEEGIAGAGEIFGVRVKCQSKRGGGPLFYSGTLL